MQGHIVITGATGVIGAAVADALIREGYEVVILARSTEAAAEKIPGAARYVAWDADKDSGEWVACIDGAKAVIHLAGKPLLESRWTEEHKKACYDSRINGTRHMVAAIAGSQKKPEVFLSASAIGYYGSFENCSDTPDITESGAEGSDFLAKICIDWEKEADPAKMPGVRVVLLRTGIVLTTQGGMLQKMMTPFNYFLGGPIGSGNQCISWIHIDDEIHAIRELLLNPAYHGPVNLVGPKPVSMKEFAGELGSVMQRPSLFPVPKLAVQLLLGEGAEYAVKGQRVVPAELLKNGFTFSTPKLFDALTDLVSGKK
ncbi:MAG: TIGR01777 family protein [Chlorobiaceae bacterium]|nr:TIGR01777 family protein [Chlorobiaceae bacterium]